MNSPPLYQGTLTDSSAGSAPVTREMVRARTRELTLLAGRSPLQVSQSDYEQAKRELTGESDLDRQLAVLDTLPASTRWDPVLADRREA